METENGKVTTTLVLGATGKTGRRVAERLGERGLPVRVGSHSGEPPFDWEDRSTWEPALRDVESAYVSYYPDLAVPGAEAAGRWDGYVTRWTAWNHVRTVAALAAAALLTVALQI